MSKQRSLLPFVVIVLALAVVIAIFSVLRTNRQSVNTTEREDSSSTAIRHREKSARTRRGRGKRKLYPTAGQDEEDVTAEEDEQTLIKTGYSISGHVLDEEGNGLADAEVVVRSGYSMLLYDFPVERSAKTDPEGGFRIENLPLKNLFLNPLKEGFYFCMPGFESYGYLAGLYPVNYVKGRNQVTGVHLEMRPGFLIAGKVVDENDESVTHAIVRLSRLPWFILPGTKVELQVDEEGRFQTSNLFPGEYWVTVMADGFLPIRGSTQVTTGTDDLLLRLQRGCEIEGYVVFKDSAGPVPGAEVVGWARRKRGRGTHFIQVYEAVADDVGHFQMRINPNEQTSLHASWENYVIAKDHTVRLDDEGYLEDILLELDLGGSVSGILREKETGNPVEGVELCIMWTTGLHKTRSSNDGRFRFDGLGPGQRRVRVMSEEYQTSGRSPSVDVVLGKETSDLEILVTRRSRVSISGKVIDIDGKPIFGVLVQPYTETGYGVSKTDGAVSDIEGKFSITRAPRRGEIEGLVVTHPEYSHKCVTLAQEKKTHDAKDIIITLEKGGSIEGFVQDAENNPKSNARVSLIAVEPRVANRHDFQLKSSLTDAAGHYLIFGIPEGTYRLRAKHGERSVQSENVQIESGQKLRDINLIFSPGGYIAGKITDNEGNPLAGIRPYASSTRAQGGSDYTNPEGKYRIEDLDEGQQYAVYIYGDYSKPKYKDVTRREVKCSSADVDFVLTPLEFGSVSGFVYGELDETPVRSFSLTLERTDGRSARTGYRDRQYQSEDGFFKCTDVPVGKYVVKVKADDLADSRSAPFEVTVGKETTTEVYMQSGGSLSGYVYRKSDGSPVTDFHIRLYPNERGRRSDSRGETFKSDDGFFIFTNLPAGAYSMTVRAKGFPTYTGETIEVQPGEVTFRDIYLEEGCTLSGHVYRKSDSSPVEKFYLTLRPKNRNVSTDYRNKEYQSDDGSFSCTDILPGKYAIQICAKGLPDFETDTFDVLENVENTLDIFISSGGTIKGKVVDEMENGIPEAVILVEVHGYRRSAESRHPELANKSITDETGAFTFTGMTPGSVTLKVTHPDYAELTVYNIKVTEDTVTEDILIKLEKGKKVYGWVKGVDGGMKAGTRIMIISSKSGYRYKEGTTDSEGRYTFENTPKGSTCFYFDEMGVYSRAFMVGDEDEKELNVDFSETGTITGVVYLPARPENSKITIYARELTDGTGSRPYSPKSVEVNPDGTFKIETIFTGKYQLYLRAYQRKTDGARTRLTLTTSPQRIVVDVSTKEESEIDITVTEISVPSDHR